MIATRKALLEVMKTPGATISIPNPGITGVSFVSIKGGSTLEIDQAIAEAVRTDSAFTKMETPSYSRWTDYTLKAST
jgi:hypothetical protein